MRSNMSEHPLASYLVEKEMTQEQLAVVLGVSYATVNHILNGRRRITPEKAIEWEKKIGIPRASLCPEIFGQEAA